jgi:hypothetical protein
MLNSGTEKGTFSGIQLAPGNWKPVAWKDQAAVNGVSGKKLVGGRSFDFELEPGGLGIWLRE